MNNEKTLAYKAALKTKKSELVTRLDALNKDKTRQRGAISADFEEQAQDVENDEVVDHLEVIELEQLEKVEVALSKIESGLYGKCEKCRSEISEKRLDAVPFSTICISCADNN